MNSGKKIPQPNKQNQILNQDDTDGNTPGGFLVALTKALAKATRVDLLGARMDMLTERYAIKMRNGDLNSGHNTVKGNLLRMFRSSQMSIITFFRYLATMEVKSVTFRITVKFQDENKPDVVVEETAYLPIDQKEQTDEKVK